MQNQQISSDLIRGHIDTIILHTLLDGDKYAEQISDTIDKKSESAYKINQATLYSALKRLESSKFVNSYQRDANGNGRRKFFTLTEKGREFADNNLSSWSYSRAIIDKLIDCAPQPIIKTEYIEKIVQVPVHVERTIIKEVEKTEEIKEDVVKNDAPITPIQAHATDNNPINTISSDSKESVIDAKEVNFRNILNGLIQTSSTHYEEKHSVAVELSPLEKDDVVNQQENIKDFNKTIIEKSNTPIKINMTEIDFSDLVVKSQKEGFKISISSKNQAKPNGTLLKNKVNLFVSLAMFLILSLELLFYTTTYKTLLTPPNGLIWGLIGTFALWPIASIILYKNAPQKTSAKDVYGDSILTTLIVVFNLLLINFAGVLLFNLNFSVKKDVLLYLIIPATLYFDILLYSIIRFNFAKSKMCRINHKN
ncbi:MAG: PadR family transcriptional regulator [Clostridiales bacterium]|nr:PadR family transcriptional regulator [Clostridiales bacterium]